MLRVSSFPVTVPSRAPAATATATATATRTSIRISPLQKRTTATVQAAHTPQLSVVASPNVDLVRPSAYHSFFLLLLLNRLLSTG